ncbi:MAG: T9SS type A sorting domain-containing protein [Bacteroidetes bacterium]|nr:T9SS type A sorting domain-containing protein [Bacteroidota bacterium]
MLNSTNNKKERVKSRFVSGKKLYSIIFIATTSIAATAQTWQWAQGAGDILNERGFSIRNDASGNSYVTGMFYSPSITFGSFTLNNADNAGNTPDVFVVKYDASGNALWAQSAGGLNNDNGFSVFPDASGNVYVTGNFSSSSITFGSTTLINASTSGTPDFFLVKYDASSGNVLWAKRAGGTDYDDGLAVCTDASGNVYVAGDFSSTSITFGSTTLTNTGSAGSGEIFLAKYDASGNVLWAKSAAGSGNDDEYGISTDGSNIYITGAYSSSTLSFGSNSITNAGSQNIFIAKYDASGNALWAKSAGGNISDFGTAISAAAGNVYITGYFSSSTVTFGSTSLTNAGGEDIFIAKYDASGNVLWAKKAGGSSVDDGLGIMADASGNAFITGVFGSTTITFGSTSLTNAGSYDIFVAKYDASGNVVWAKGAGGTNDDFSYSVSINSSNLFITGDFRSPSLAFGSTTLTNAGGEDVFTAKLSGISAVEENNFENEITVYPNPTSGNFEVRSEKLEVRNIEIYNVMGEKMYSSTVNRKQETVNLSASNGIYFLQLKTENGIVNKKLIINK